MQAEWLVVHPVGASDFGVPPIQEIGREKHAELFSSRLEQLRAADAPGVATLLARWVDNPPLAQVLGGLSRLHSPNTFDVALIGTGGVDKEGTAVLAERMCDALTVRPAMYGVPVRSARMVSSANLDEPSVMDALIRDTPPRDSGTRVAITWGSGATNLALGALGWALAAGTQPYLVGVQPESDDPFIHQLGFHSGHGPVPAPLMADPPRAVLYTYVKAGRGEVLKPRLEQGAELSVRRILGDRLAARALIFFTEPDQTQPEPFRNGTQAHAEAEVADVADWRTAEGPSAFSHLGEPALVPLSIAEDFSAALRRVNPALDAAAAEVGAIVILPVGPKPLVLPLIVAAHEIGARRGIPVFIRDLYYLRLRNTGGVDVATVPAGTGEPTGIHRLPIR